MTKSGSAALAICVLILFQACRPTEKASAPPPSASGLQSVPLAELIAHPKKYHGKRVRVVGFCHLEFEGNGLYIQGADYFHHVTKHAVWLDVEESPEVLLLNNDYVRVDGTFDGERLGHLSMFSGSLSDITKIEHASPP